MHGVNSREEIRYRSLHRYGIKTTVDVMCMDVGSCTLRPRHLTLVLHHPFPALSPLHFAFAARQVRLKGKAKDCKQANFLLLSKLVPIPPPNRTLDSSAKRKGVHTLPFGTGLAPWSSFQTAGNATERSQLPTGSWCMHVPRYFSALSSCTSDGDTCRYFTTTSGLLLHLALTGEQLPKELYINDICS